MDVDNKKAGRDKRYDLLYDAKVLNRYFRNMDASPLAKRNSLQLFTDGQENSKHYLKIFVQRKKPFMWSIMRFLMTQLAINF